MKLYLAGPMTGIAEFNYPLFNRVAADLRRAGHAVINPAENDGGDTTLDWSYYMRQDFHHVLSVDGIAVLAGWQNSRGATLEVALAQALGLGIVFALTMEPLTLGQAAVTFSQAVRA